MATKLSLNDGIALVTGVSLHPAKPSETIYADRSSHNIQAASGLGRETAHAFAEAGVRGLVFADINEQGAKDSADASKQYARHPDYKAVAVYVDITDEASVQNMVETTVKEFGRIDYNVNSAGVSLRCQHAGAASF